MTNLPGDFNSALANTVEDKFIDNVLGRLDGVASDLTPQQIEELNKQKYAAGNTKQDDFGVGALVPVESKTLGGGGGGGGALTATRDINKTNHEIVFSSSEPGVWKGKYKYHYYYYNYYN